MISKSICINQRTPQSNNRRTPEQTDRLLFDFPILYQTLGWAFHSLHPSRSQASCPPIVQMREQAKRAEESRWRPQRGQPLLSLYSAPPPGQQSQGLPQAWGHFSCPILLHCRLTLYTLCQTLGAGKSHLKAWQLTLVAQPKPGAGTRSHLPLGLGAWRGGSRPL